ncbi:39S ribosomal protein L17, mitochondrial, partial [Asbolus verrucosus]
MNQADVAKLVSQLRIKVNPRLRKFRSPGGPEERLNKLRKTVTALIKHERLELNYPRADESRMYAERLISDAIRYGDCHKETMEMADYWLIEKQLVHKLFKVLVPRFANYNTAYTKIYKAPTIHPETRLKAVLELRGNPYPPLLPDMHHNRNLIHNVLLDEAKKAYRTRKYAEIAAKIDAAGQNATEETSK